LSSRFSIFCLQMTQEEYPVYLIYSSSLTFPCYLYFHSVQLYMH
jgi:hypothetical protein